MIAQYPQVSAKVGFRVNTTNGVTEIYAVWARVKCVRCEKEIELDILTQIVACDDCLEWI